MSKTNELILKPISDLLNEAFFIPAYQRGYRWTRRQVTDLLDDISEFQKQSEERSKSAFYCLQPVVVKKRGEEWELVDGQQRLTTISIILSYLKEVTTLLGKKRYRLRYETRPDSESYLEDINENQKTDNIDFYHMYQAREAIHEWFEARDGMYKVPFLQTLLNDDDAGKNVQVIWYQINESIDVTAVFTRLNMGKIPLTNAELVKALFLKSSNFEDSNRYLHQLKIAQEWDEIERTLQLDDLWFFISNKATEANRIEFVLNLVASQLALDGVKIPTRDRFYVFLTFDQWLQQNGVPIDQAWERVKRCFMTLKEWYEDRTLFHLVGFLVSRNTAVGDIMSLFQSCPTKREFRRTLILMVFKKVFPDLLPLDNHDSHHALKQAIDEYLAQLSYGVSNSQNSQLFSVLLFFNIATLLANVETNARFQFDRFKKEYWDIEHIRSVASDSPSGKPRQRAWLADIIYYIGDEFEVAAAAIPSDRDQLKILLKDAKGLLAQDTFNTEQFESIFNRVLDFYAPNWNIETEHSIGNLTLLDSSTNRSYQNHIFPIKRSRIIALDKTATFLPVCTKNAFLKYYSNCVSNIMLWDPQDSDDHQRAMTELLASFFAAKGMKK